MNKRLLALICAIAMMLSMLGSAPVYVSAEDKPVSICFEGKQLEFLQTDSVIERDGYALAPAQELASQTGWKLEFGYAASDPGLIKLENELLGLKVDAFIGRNKIYINGEERNMDASPEVINGILMFPVRGFFHAMNCSVEWDEGSSTINVNQPFARVFSDKTHVMNKADTAPVIDGVGNDVAWAGAKKLGDFSTMFYNEKPNVHTEFKVTYDDEALYLYVNNEGRPVPLEGISVVFAPENIIGTDTPYFRFMLIPEPENNLGRTGGTIVSYRTANQILLDKTVHFDAEYSVKDNSWAAEVKIPYSKLVKAEGEAAPVVEDADEWKINVSRIRPFTEGISSWVPVRYSFYQDLPTAVSYYNVDIPFAAVTNRTGSIFFGKYPTSDVFDNTEKPYTMVVPENAGMLYRGYTEKMVFFDKRSLNTKNARFYGEWVNELGEKYKADILRVYEKGGRIFFYFNHPKMINEGLYRLNIYAEEDLSREIKKYEFMFDKQEVMDAGVIYTSFAVKTSPDSRTVVADTYNKAAVDKLMSIIPKVIGYIFTGNPDRPDDKATNLFTYDYANAPYKITAKLAGISGISTTAEKGIGTIPAQYSNNRSLTVKSKTGNDIVYNYYEDENGKQYFLDQHIDYLAKDALRTEIVKMANTDPVGAAYVLYETAKAYQDWMPSADYYWRNYPIQWNWGPPFHYYGGMWNRWYTAELSSMKNIVDAYGIVRKTDAFDIVSQKVGLDVEKFIYEEMFKTSLEFTKTYPILNHNMEYNNWLGRVAMSKATGDPDYVHETIDLVDNYASSQFMLDGFWKEISVSYHSQSLNGLTNTINALKGWSDPAGYISPRTGQNIQNLDMDSKYPALKAANLMTGSVIYPNGRFFPIQDTWANDVTGVAAAKRNLGTLLMPAANIARMSKGTGTSTNQLYLTYTSKYGHNQYDPLSLALYSNGQELLPDLGYTHTIYRQYATSTMSHNTVLVDSKDASAAGDAKYGGKLETFADIDETVQIMKAAQENAYPGLEEYDREPWYIKMEGSNDTYALDIFRVDGGSRHEYTLNGDAFSENVTFTPNVEMEYYSTHLLPPGTKVTQPTGELDKGAAEGNYYGYLYIEDVKKADLADGKYEITMSTKNGTTERAGMKITGFAGADSQLYIGKAPSLQPLRSGPKGTGNDTNEAVKGWYTPKMVVRREGTDIASTFVNVIEPYAANSASKITAVEKLETVNPKDVAMKISYRNVTDVLLSSSNPSVPMSIGDITFTGKMAMVRYIDGKVSKVYSVGTDSVKIGDRVITGEGRFEGKITGTMRKATGDSLNAFVVDKAISSSAAGKTITVTHPDGSVHAFEIVNVIPQGEKSVIEIKDADPGFEILLDGSSEMRFYPLTKWKGEHSFKIEMETVISY